MSDPNELCELHRLDDYGRLLDVARLLEAQGIEADVWPERARRSVPWASRSSRLMVYCRDLVYARWLAGAAGLDTWPEEEADEDS